MTIPYINNIVMISLYNYISVHPCRIDLLEFEKSSGGQVVRHRRFIIKIMALIPYHSFPLGERLKIFFCEQKLNEYTWHTYEKLIYLFIHVEILQL